MATTTPATGATVRSASTAAGWLLPIGGLLFLAAGMLHPNEDLPGAPMSEQLRVMYVDPAWYPAHTLMLAGVALTAVAVAALARRRSLADRRAQLAAAVAAVATTIAVPASLLHLVAATDANRIAHHQSMPLSDVQLIVETVTFPLFSFAIAALAVVGALTRTLGNRVAAVVGGIGYGLASGTAAFTSAFDPLFPTAIGIAIWAMIAGIGLMRRRTPTVMVTPP